MSLGWKITCRQGNESIRMNILRLVEDTRIFYKNSSQSVIQFTELYSMIVDCRRIRTPSWIVQPRHHGHHGLRARFGHNQSNYTPSMTESSAMSRDVWVSSLWDVGQLTRLTRLQSIMTQAAIRMIDCSVIDCFIDWLTDWLAALRDISTGKLLVRKMVARQCFIKKCK